jgi:hypothetical protein
VAPLVLPDGSGIYPDMVAYLNRQKLDGLSFKLVYLPRKRLQFKSGELDGIVIGMMPHWFDDSAEKIPVDRAIRAGPLCGRAAARQPLHPAAPACWPAARWAWCWATAIPTWRVDAPAGRDAYRRPQ